MRWIAVAENQRNLFWLLQLGGWSAWAFTYYLGVAVFGDVPSLYPLYLLAVASVGLSVTLILRQIYRLSWEWSPPRRLVIALLGSCLGGLLWMLSRVLMFGTFYPNEAVAMAEKGPSLLIATLQNSISAASVMLVWSAIYFCIKYYLQSQEEKQRYLKVLSQAHEAQLKMLRYQLNPHFLFNTLNAISTLVLDRQTETANSMVTKLSRFLRYSLDNDPVQEVTVSEEMGALALYLDIEKVRFGDHLTLEFDIDPAARDALMPSLLLQPLVENSIKYAVSQAINGGRIQISACVDRGNLLLSVADDGEGLTAIPERSANSGGVGLANTRDRLQELYGERQSFWLSRTEPHGLTVSIRLPLAYSVREAA